MKYRYTLTLLFIFMLCELPAHATYFGILPSKGGLGTNLYEYTLSDPINLIDPTGNIAEDYVANRTSITGQVGVGLALTAYSGAILRAGIEGKSPVLIGFAGLMAYEASQQLGKAFKRTVDKMNASPYNSSRVPSVEDLINKNNACVVGAL